MTWEKHKDHHNFTGTKPHVHVAERMRQAALAAALEDRNVHHSQLLPVALAFCIAAAIGAVFDGPLPFVPVFDLPVVDLIVSGVPVGQGDLSQVVFIMLRGLVLFLMAGLPCFAARVIMRFSTGRVSPIVACWMGILLVPFFYFLFV